MFGGSSEEKAAPVAAQAPTMVTNAVAEFPIDKKAREKREREEAQALKRNQRDVDKAASTVAFIIGLNGYHCIKVIDVQQTESSSLYGVACLTDHHGHRTNYMVNAETNDVTEI